MSRETTKATLRRWKEHDAGVFPWKDILTGPGIDVGAGDDPLAVENCMAFDKQHGDAQTLSHFVKSESMNFLHASQCLEHMPDVRAAIRDWLKVVRPGGYLAFTVPDVGAYENFTYPSKFNPDHRASFSMIYRGSAFPQHFHIPTLTAELSDAAETLLMRYVEVGYDWKRREVDQTWRVEDAVEIWNEVVLQKK